MQDGGGKVHLALVQILHSYMKGRTFCVKLKATRSNPKPLRAGVPQGSLLSPTLFSIFVRDVPRSPGTDLALYADDTAIFCRSLSQTLVTRRLQSALDDLQEWFRMWRIAINPEKSTALIITRRGYRRVQDNLEMFDRQIPWRSEAKYLGVTLDTRLTWKAHVTAVTNRAKVAM